MDETPAFHELDSITVGKEWCCGVEQDRIALAKRNGHVELLDSTGRETVQLPTPVTDIELDRYLLCLSEDTVNAYTTTEVELWTQTVSGGTAVASFGQKDVLGVVTSAGTVLGLDIETGRQLFEIDRPYDDIDQIGVAGGQGRLWIAAWSFLVGIDANGTVQVDMNLDRTIEDVSVLGDVVVAVCKDGSVTALDRETGKQRWSNSASFSSVTPTGDTALTGMTDAGTGLIHSEGRIEQLELPAGEAVVSAADLSVVTVIDGTSATLYRRGPGPAEQLTTEFLTSTVTGESPIRLYVENEGTSPVQTTLELETAVALSVTDPYVELELDPGKSREIAFRPNQLPAVEEFEVTARANEAELSTAVLSVDRQVSITDDLHIETGCTEVTGNTGTWRVTVTNDGPATLETVTVEGKVIGKLEPGEAGSITRKFELDGSERTLSIEATHRGKTETIELPVSIPSGAVECDLTERTDPSAVDIELTRRFDGEISGDLTVTVDDESIRRRCSLTESDRVRLVVLLPWRGCESVSVESPLFETESSLALETTPQHRDNSRNARTQTGNSPENTDRKKIRIKREIPAEADLANRFTEQIRIENATDDPLEELILSDGQQEYTLERLEPGGSQQLRRDHALFEPGEHEIHPLSVETAYTAAATTDTETVKVSPTDIEFRAEAVPSMDGTAARFTIENHGDRMCEIKGVGIDISPEKPGEVWEPDGFVVDSGERQTLHRTVEVPAAQLDRSTRVALLQYTCEGTRHSRRTLAPLRSGGEGGAEPFSVTVLDRTQVVAGNQGIVELAIKNTEKKVVHDVSVHVEGEMILETALSQNELHAEQFGPGEIRTMLVDVLPETVGTARLEISTSGTVDGNAVRQLNELTGPVSESTEQWTEKVADQWETVRERTDEGVVVETSHLVSPFQPREGGSRR